jgi:predicted metal-binding protein
MKNRIFLILIVALSISCKKSAEESLLPIEVAQQQTFKTRVLVEKISSVNCGSCPLAQYELNNLKTEYGDDLVYVSHYLFGALNHDHTQYLLSKINKTYFTPLSLINRKEKGEGTVFFQLYAWKDEISSLLASQANVGIGISSAYADERVSLDIELMTNSEGSDSSRLHVYLIEKTVIGEGADYNQKNYGYDDPDSPYYNQGEFIVGFEHKNILRKRVSSPDGELINWQDSMDRLSFNFDFQLGSEKSNRDYSIVAFVSRGEVPAAGIIENTQMINLGDSVSVFE